MVHDFPDPKVGKAIPYGIYDVGRNIGWVNVGQDHDTASFAVESLRRWWRRVGAAAYPTADRLLVSADSGGSNGYRVRLWKVELQGVASRTGLRVVVAPSLVFYARERKDCRVDRQEQARKVISGLKTVYPEATCELNFTSPLELLVATILSAQCTDQRVNMVTADLFKKYRSAEDYAAAPLGVLEEEIRPTGFFRQKSMALRAMGQKLVEEFGGEVPRTMEEMIRIPGAARKTANVVLGTAFGIPSGVVVDTHVRRLAYRLGLSDETDPNKIEKDLMAVVPQNEWIWFGHAIIWHGRRTCSARAPACDACVLEPFCPRRGVGGPSRTRRRARPAAKPG